MQIRRALPQDAPRIQALIDGNVPGGTLLPRTREFILAHVEHYLVAEADGAVVGCVHLEEYAPSLAEVRSLAVDAGHHGRGVGSALVAAAEALAARRGYRTVFAVSDRDVFFRGRGYEPRHIPELDRERSEVSRFKGVFAKEVERG
ncbi:MAG TPA: GNAT family N-acetyltransferase [Gemmatimonadales bacterium]